MVPVDDLVLEVESVLISFGKEVSLERRALGLYSVRALAKLWEQVVCSGSAQHEARKPGLHSGSTCVEGSNQKEVQETW